MFGEGEGPQWLDYLDCMGDEESVWGCGHAGVGYVDPLVCPHFFDLGVTCEGEEGGREGRREEGMEWREGGSDGGRERWKE